MNRTLVETVHSMLSDANLLKRFWAETLSTAVYLCNRSPTTVVQGKTPFETWMKEKPYVGHLKVFGCLCYAHVAKHERQKFVIGSKKTNHFTKNITFFFSFRLKWVKIPPRCKLNYSSRRYVL